MSISGWAITPADLSEIRGRVDAAWGKRVDFITADKAMQQFLFNVGQDIRRLLDSVEERDREIGRLREVVTKLATSQHYEYCTDETCPGLIPHIARLTGDEVE